MIPAAFARKKTAASAARTGIASHTAALRVFPFVCLLGFAALYQALGIYVVGNTFQSYAAFSYAYGNFLSIGEFPQWFPYAAYGSPAEPYLMTFLGPFQILAIFAGALFRFSDVWTMYFFCAVLESCAFVGCAYLLGRELYKSEIAASAVATWVAVSVFWNIQVFWTHRILLYVPLMLYLALRFHRTGDVRQIIRLGLAGIIALIGSLAYLAPVYAFLLCLFFALLRIFDRKNGFTVLGRPNMAALAEFGVLLLLAGLYAFLFANAFDGVSFTAPGRDSVTGGMGLDAFLHYAGSALVKLPEFVLGHWTFHTEFFFYLGVVATGLVLFAVHRLRDGVFWALGCACTCLFLLSLGPHGLVGYAVYWFPGMKNFRHLVFLLPMVRVLLFFLAGYGLDHLLEQPREQRVPALLWIAAVALAIILLKHLLPLDQPASADWSWFVPETSLGIALLACVCVRPLAARQPLALGLVLALAVAWELGSAQYFLEDSSKTLDQRSVVRNPGNGVDIFLVQRHPFLNSRFTLDRGFPRSQALLELAMRWPLNNVIVQQYVGADPCVPVFRVDYATPGVVALLDRVAPGALVRSNAEKRDNQRMFQWLTALQQPWFREACGCDGNKLVLETPQGQRLDVSGAVRHFSANRLELVLDSGPGGGVLYYADAYHPGWKARVDGQAAGIALARGAFKSVAVPPGIHTVALAFYNPWREWARRGLAVAAVLALAHLFATALREQAQRRRPLV